LAAPPDAADHFLCGGLVCHNFRLSLLVLPHRQTLHYKPRLALDYAEMIDNGLWFTPLREALDAFFASVSQTTTGEVTLRLYKGNVEPVRRVSAFSLYALDIASFTMGAAYDQKDALGFINLTGLPIKVRASRIVAKTA